MTKGVRMKKYAIILLTALFIFGCAGKPKDKKVLVKVNNYEITPEEFEEEFKESAYARNDTLESRKEFLNLLVNRKLILQDAQSKNLDKDRDFLKMIEKFWEQSLLKLALDKKSKEIAGLAQVSDKAIEEAYQKMLKEGKTDKTYEQMYNQIKWEIIREKETQLMDEWIERLREKSNIKVNYELLKQGKSR
jgi:PBP1b-binding outer membrane lipoprotein LpoB